MLSSSKSSKKSDLRENARKDFDKATLRQGHQTTQRISALKLDAVPTSQVAKVTRASPGRPKAKTTKVAMSIRLDPDVLQAFRSTGKGWQTRMNKALKEWVNEHMA